ncbi:MAG: 2-C-methyl-D-erythritol 2,4-cyclodiphosphate synthase [Glaciihabitans sp.]|nr:2-C-methyl-D-erythritol 2,4-cyclodiphosphate synthase [Glaciihabitans sp.]
MSESLAIGVIVVAAGSGTRLGHELPKAFVPIGDRTVLEWSLESVFGMSESAQIVVVAPPDRLDLARELVAKAAGPASRFITVVPGGSTRQVSVAAGLAALDHDIGIVLIHDSARPFTPSALFDAIVARIRATGDGAIPGLPVSDTVKTTEAGLALSTVDRSLLAAVGTPQGFPRVELDAAYAAASTEYTDDAALFSAAGHAVHVLAGDPLGFKITTTWDLRRAEQLVAQLPGMEVIEATPARGIRTGIGIDVHAFDETQPLWLGGLHWPDETGLAGHSDGDAIAHAICDALLSASGLGDLGGLFGTDDPKFADAHGDVFIRETVALVESSGYEIRNVAVQVIGNHPRLGPRRLEVENRLTELVGAPVSVSATTSDGLGFTGRGEGVAAIATALLA